MLPLHQITNMTSGKIYLIPCNISDSDNAFWLPAGISETIKNTQYFLAEELRTTRRFISSLKLGIDISGLHISVLDKKTKATALDKLMAPLKSGHDMGILSESGCPGVADPGSIAVAWAHRHQIEVVPLVGPSSILLALMGSGFNGQKFCFHGYLPIPEKDRVKALIQLEEESKRFKQTQIFIETPYRNIRMLDSILSSCKKQTLLCIARDLTGSNQLLKTMTIAQWNNAKPDLGKFPVVFLLYSGEFR